MKKQLADLSAQATKAFDFLKRYVVLLFFLVLCGIYGFLAYRINGLTNADPTDAAVAEKLNSVTRPRIDQNSIDKMRELEETNVKVETLFKDARKNPFNE